MRNPWEHERFNFQFKNNMKEFHNDHKNIRVGYLKKSPLHGLHSVITGGKLQEAGIDILKKNEELPIMKDVLQKYNTSTF